MKKQLMTHGPRIPQTHLRKGSPANHNEKVEIPPMGEFERQYADEPAPKEGEQVIIPPLPALDREYDETSATLPGDAEVIIPADVRAAEAQAALKREQEELADVIKEIHQDRADEEFLRKENEKRFREGKL